MKITLDVSKVLLLDTSFTPDMLENNQAVICEIQGQSTLMVNVDLDEITRQVKKNEDRKTPKEYVLPPIHWDED